MQIGRGRPEWRGRYPELAGRRLGVFDLRTKLGAALQQDWQALLRFIDEAV